MPVLQDSTADLDTTAVLNALMGLKRGDHSVRLPVEWTGLPGKVADAFNAVVELNERMSKELARKAFHGLNPSLQDTFILQKAEGWTNRELAQALGITVSTVKSRIFRARVRLRQQLRTLSDTSQQPIALQG